MEDTYDIHIEGSYFNNGSSVIHNENTGNSSQHEELLCQLQALQKSLECTEPIISCALAELQNAIRRQNKPKIASMIAQLSSGFAASILANIASPLVLSFLGIVS